MPDIFDKETRSRIMSRIRSKDTKVEITFRKALWQGGVRGYRIHCKMPGKPDIVFTRKKIIVFIDGDFWHGYLWKNIGKIPPQGYWQKKIDGNMQRDFRQSEEYRREGWTVIRFWEHEVLLDIERCVQKVKEVLDKAD